MIVEVQVVESLAPTLLLLSVGSTLGEVADNPDTSPTLPCNTLGSGHLRMNHRLQGFRGESLELTSYLFCPGLADILWNGTAVTAGPPPPWSDRATTSLLALSSLGMSRLLLGKGRLGCWGGEDLLWPVYAAGASVWVSGM